MVDKKTWAARALPGVTPEREMEILSDFNPQGDDLRQVITMLGRAAASTNDYAVSHGAAPVPGHINSCANCNQNFPTMDAVRTHVTQMHRRNLEACTNRDLLLELYERALKGLKAEEFAPGVRFALEHLEADSDHLLKCLEKSVLDDGCT